jgi:hypothetical protein
LDINNYRDVWIHGIGHIPAGFSKPWSTALNDYLKPPFTDSNNIETIWSSVFGIMMQALGLDTPSVPLTPQEQATSDDLRKALETVLAARRESMALAQGASSPRVTGAAAISLPSTSVILRNYIGEFADYLASRRVRNAIKEKLKQQLRPLAGRGYAISIIAHSWGTVVAYESLLDLEVELPTLKLNNLFTLGSPLWLVHLLLDDRSGRKPHNVSKWINIYAQGDVIGAGLKPGFQVNQDSPVPDASHGKDAHNSYFLQGNTAVLRDILAKTIP